LNIPFTHDVSFISTERPSYYAVKTGSSLDYKESGFKNLFTHREKEIIQQMSVGKDYNQIAQLLFVSPHTITTHKKNILSKSGCKNTPELITKCIREGVI
jgi:DNA-binding CsgD family transcriptional regulator